MIVFYIRWRVKCIGGRFFLSILDLRLLKDGDKKLEEMLLIFLRNIELDFLIVNDYVILIIVIIVRNMKSKIFLEKDFKNLVEWSKIGYEMIVWFWDDERL